MLVLFIFQSLISLSSGSSSLSMYHAFGKDKCDMDDFTYGIYISRGSSLGPKPRCYGTTAPDGSIWMTSHTGYSSDLVGDDLNKAIVFAKNTLQITASHVPSSECMEWNDSVKWKVYKTDECYAIMDLSETRNTFYQIATCNATSFTLLSCEDFSCADCKIKMEGDIGCTASYLSSKCVPGESVLFPPTNAPTTTTSNSITRTHVTDYPTSTTNAPVSESPTKAERNSIVPVETTESFSDTHTFSSSFWLFVLLILIILSSL